MADIILTEQNVSDMLILEAKNLGVVAPRCIVFFREQKGKSTIQRTVKFALVVPINSELLIDKLIALCLKNENIFYFIGSDVNLQSDLEVDYLIFEANIFAKIK